ncbi:MAG TPA: DNA-formamidopyrimidine glycosylase family protein [Actinomycetota bacterium]|nr:DNA-formamidopyrimidine glycosylase family protein [Actinomycetota bacterium]
MPELADVEYFRQFFSRHAAGKQVAGVWVDPTILRNATPEILEAALRGRRFEEPERLGKWLICRTDGPVLLLHFGMTGDLIWSEEEPARHRHDRLIIEFVEGGELRYRNMRKLGGVWIVHDDDEQAGLLQALGPDALSVGRLEFLARLGRRRGGLKAALMDQTFLAGVGNILADEILWQARLHPKTSIEDLSEQQRRDLHTAMRRVLREAVEKYDYISRKRSWLSNVRGLRDAACPRCGTRLERTVAGGRTTYFCPACQPAEAVRMIAKRK